MPLLQQHFLSSLLNQFPVSRFFISSSLIPLHQFLIPRPIPHTTVPSQSVSLDSPTAVPITPAEFWPQFPNSSPQYPTEFHHPVPQQSFDTSTPTEFWSLFPTRVLAPVSQQSSATSTPTEFWPQYPKRVLAQFPNSNFPHPDRVLPPVPNRVLAPVPNRFLAPVPERHFPGRFLVDISVPQLPSAQTAALELKTIFRQQPYDPQLPGANIVMICFLLFLRLPRPLTTAYKSVDSGQLQHRETVPGNSSLPETCRREVREVREVQGARYTSPKREAPRDTPQG